MKSPVFTSKAKKKFLEIISRTGNISEAARQTRTARRTHYNWMDSDPEYAKAFNEAMEDAADNLELEARRRAVDGVEEPVYYKGEVCGTVTKYSDSLLMFLLKGAKPDKYADRQKTEMSGTDGGPIKVSVDLL